jgi:hypothetical protein
MEWVTPHLRVLIFMLEKKAKHIFMRNLFLYHCINVEKLIKAINNRKLKVKLETIPSNVG